jgi:outer membrane receptor protein involved in Fe transport
LTFETGLKYAGRGFRGSAIYFYNKLDELLQPLPGTLNGLSFYDINQNGVRDITEVEVFQRQNIGRATIQGVEVSADAAPHRDVRFYGNFTYTHGTDELADEPFPGIPPATGTVGARWFRATRAAPWVEVETHFAAAQRRLHPADRFNPMIGPFGTDGFVILNARGGVTVADGFRFTLGLENALNEAYRYHASGIFRPGRQVTVGLEYRLTGSRATRLRSEKEDR